MIWSEVDWFIGSSSRADTLPLQVVTASSDSNRLPRTRIHSVPVHARQSCQTNSHIREYLEVRSWLDSVEVRSCLDTVRRYWPSDVREPSQSIVPSVSP